jgi:hypothetical protein
MAYDFRLPDDLYYWGQNRLGSLVPLIGHVLLWFMPTSPAVTVSIAQYLLLLIGYLAFASLLHSNLLKIILALAWFLPLVYFTELIAVAHPYGPQMAFIGIAVVLANRLLEDAQLEKPQLEKGVKRQLFITLIAASLFISIWLSDFSVITAFIFAGIVLVAIYQQRGQYAHREGLGRWGVRAADMLNLALTSALGVAFILYAKANAAGNRTEYATFSQPHEIQEVVTKLLTSAANTLSFKNNPLINAQMQINFLGIHAVLVALLILGILYVCLCVCLYVCARDTRTRDTRIRQPQQEPLAVSRWVYFFLTNAIVGLILLPLFRWVYINDISLRYFTVVYVSLWLAALLFADRFKGASFKLISLLLVLVAVTSSLTLPQQTFALNRSPSTLQQLQEIAALGEAGFIGEYWSSYILCIANPGQQHCTPFDPRNAEGREMTGECRPRRRWQERPRGVRCPRCARRVFRSETVYLVKDRWLNEFPQETQQFGHCLVKTGAAKQVSGYTIAPYRVKN